MPNVVGAGELAAGNSPSEAEGIRRSQQSGTATPKRPHLLLQRAPRSLPPAQSMADNLGPPRLPASSPQPSQANHIPLAGSEQMADSMATSPPKAIGRSV